MYLLRRLRFQNASILRSLIMNNRFCKDGYLVLLSSHIPKNVRLLQTTHVMLADEKSQYEYDPKTDSFRQKTQTNYPPDHYQHQQRQSDEKGFRPFLRRFVRNLFLLTGGVVWIGALFVSLFVDVKEEELLHHIKDLDDEVRLLAFYDVGRTKGDLAKIMSKDKHFNEQHDVHYATSSKQTSFLKVVRQLQNNKVVTDYLGTPVQLCGFRAAVKIGQMIQSFQHLAEHGIKEHLHDDTNQNTWNADCILEGTKGLALLTLEFQRIDRNSDWIPVRIQITSLNTVSDQCFIDESASLPLGVSLS